MEKRNSAVRWTADAHRNFCFPKWRIQHLACCALLLPAALLTLYRRPACLQWHNSGYLLSPDTYLHAFLPSHIEENTLDAPRPAHLAASPDHSCMCMPRTTCRQDGTKSVPVLPLTFQPLPLGAITPLGWMNDVMSSMANGLAGHQKDFYHYVNDSSWLGGSSEYSVLNEGFPYWFNGLVPLAYGIGDERLIYQVHDALNYVLDHQQADGWLGPETNTTARDLWARFPLFLGFIQVLEAEPSQTPRLLPSMYKFINLMHSMLLCDLGFLEYWGEVRYQDMIISLQWLHEHTPPNNTRLLFDTMRLLRLRGRDWADYYDANNYMFDDLDTIKPVVTVWSYSYPWVHGVNVGQCKLIPR